MGIVHNILFRHYSAEKAGVGTFSFCVQRYPREKLYGAAFRPDLPGAEPQLVPSPEALTQMIMAQDALTAMAIMRAAGGE